MKWRITLPIAMSRFCVSPVMRCFDDVYAKLSNFHTRAEQRLDQLYKKNIFTASTVLPLFSVALTSMMRLFYYDYDYDKISCAGNAFGTPLFFCELLVMAAGSVHVLISLATLFSRSFHKGIALRARLAASQVFPVLGSGLVALILINVSFTIYYLIDYDFNTFEAPNTYTRYRAFVFFTSGTFHIIVCYNRLLAFYSMPRLYTASWTMMIILIVCVSAILDYIRRLTPAGPTNTFLTIIVISVRTIAMIWTAWRNALCFMIIARRRNWRRMTRFVEMANSLCGWMVYCIPAMNFDIKYEDLLGRGIGGTGERSKYKGKSEYGEIGQGGESKEENHLSGTPAISPDDGIDTFAIDLAPANYGNTPSGGPSAFGLDDLDNPGTAETDWTSIKGSGMGLEQLAEIPEDDGTLSDMKPSGSHKVGITSDSHSDVGKDKYELQDILPQDVLALSVAIVSTFNVIFLAIFFPQGMQSSAGSNSYTLCDRVNINVIYSFYMLIIQHRLSLVYIHEVDVDFLIYHRNFRDVSKDLAALLTNLLPEDIKGRLMERMSVVLQGDLSAEEALPPLSQCTEESEVERATERHCDDIEISCSDISLISQVQSSIFGVCMASDMVQPKISSDKIVYRFNAGLLEKVKLTI